MITYLYSNNKVYPLLYKNAPRRTDYANKFNSLYELVQYTQPELIGDCSNIILSDLTQAWLMNVFNIRPSKHAKAVISDKKRILDLMQRNADAITIIRAIKYGAINLYPDEDFDENFKKNGGIYKLEHAISLSEAQKHFKGGLDSNRIIDYYNEHVIFKSDHFVFKFKLDIVQNNEIKAIFEKEISRKVKK